MRFLECAFWNAPSGMRFLECALWNAPFAAPQGGRILNE
jgi:hypothetical protein